MNWFARYRQEWIAEALRVYGYINRGHLVRKFGISVPQASMDLREYQRACPGAVRYDKSRKRYVASAARGRSDDGREAVAEGDARYYRPPGAVDR